MISPSPGGEGRVRTNPPLPFPHQISTKIWQRNHWQRNGKKEAWFYSPAQHSHADHSLAQLLPEFVKTYCCLPFMSRKAYVGCMNRIQVSPEIHFGKPHVAGTRIPVQAVLELVREAIPFEAIIRDYYPDLKMEDIQACLQYAIDVVQMEDIHVGVPS
jgi:uncharacterized protein (DUF433 family)